MKRVLLILCLLAACACQRREAMNYLTAYMPAGDRDTLSAELLEHNVDYALRARREFSWTRALPDSIFLNEVLPYAVVDEPREDWRPKFYDIFAPKVREAKDLREAIDIVNRDINKTVGVEYDTRRKRTNQAPSESMEQGMASCTGLSIILVDALRSVGIPARFVGTAAWWDDRGNHSWVEVWIDGKWHFTEFYADAAGLDNGWFIADAGQGDPLDRQHAVWAVSWRPTGEAFPMVWTPDSREVHAVNVTERYNARYKEISDENVAAGTHVPVRFTIWLDAAHSTGSADRVATNVDVFRGTQQMGGGRTSGPHDDMNKVLTFSLAKNARYTFRYSGENGDPAEVEVTVGEEPLDAAGYFSPKRR
jgi:transglutaminase-like putative cysteine protease